MLVVLWVVRIENPNEKISPFIESLQKIRRIIGGNCGQQSSKEHNGPKR